jgi:hypothetical protein
MYTTISYPDVNGDGSDDICARADTGIRCALSDGDGFGTFDPWQNVLSDANGWGADVSLSGTIAFPDVDGDGSADLCARSDTGVRCALSDGTKFGTFDPALNALSDANGWNADASRYGTIRYPNVGPTDCD